MNNIKTWAPIIIALVLMVGVFAGLNLIRRSNTQTIESKADVEFGVSFSPRVLTGIAKDSEFSVDLILHTTGRLVSSADIELSYPDNLRLVDFRADKTGSGLETDVIKGEPDNFSNTLRYVGINKSGNLPVRNTIRIGQLKFKAIKDGLAKVELTKAIITIPGDNNTIEPNLDYGEYNVGLSSPQPSPSSSAVSSPSPSPSTPPANACINGAVKGHRCVDNTDFVEWFKEWSGLSNTKNADFFPECRADGSRGDGEINIADFEVWRRESGGVNKCL